MTKTIAYQQIELEGDNVVFEVAYGARVSAESLFPWFTQPALLTKWWAEQATVDPQPGGTYEMYWSEINKRLTGSILVWQPGKHLAFKWQWEDEFEGADKRVDVIFGESHATLTHSGYGDSDIDKKARQDHIGGWGYFLGLLQTALVEQEPTKQ